MAIFVVQKHKAKKLHYDLRLENEGVLKSWAIPKEPPLLADIKRLAVETEDHPLSWADFEGTIPKGQYGAGTVEIWDKGLLDVKLWEKDKIEFEISGKLMKGTYIMIRYTRTGTKNWLLWKKNKYP